MLNSALYSVHLPLKLPTIVVEFLVIHAPLGQEVWQLSALLVLSETSLLAGLLVPTVVSLSVVSYVGSSLLIPWVTLYPSVSLLLSPFLSLVSLSRRVSLHHSKEEVNVWQSVCAL